MKAGFVVSWNLSMKEPDGDAERHAGLLVLKTNDK
jgi:hypothetical protein